jgi:manganese transport protein
MEAFIISLVAIIGLSFLAEILMAKPDLGEVVKGFVPSIPNNEALYIAIGIIGATVMPHNLYLHSSIVQTRAFDTDDAGKRQAIRLATIDSSVALGLALFINAAILILAASTFHVAGRTDVAEIGRAYELLSPTLGAGAASVVFAVALLASGQNSTVTGTLAGQIVAEGFLDLKIPVWARRMGTRLLAIVPAVIVVALMGNRGATDLLVLSQVILSLQLPFAVVPLVAFTSDPAVMGSFANARWVKWAAWSVTGVIITLNITLLASFL